MITIIELNAKKLSAAQMVPTVKLLLRRTPRLSNAGRGAGNPDGTRADSPDTAAEAVRPLFRASARPFIPPVASATAAPVSLWALAFSARSHARYAAAM